MSLVRAPLTNLSAGRFTGFRYSDVILMLLFRDVPQTLRRFLPPARTPSVAAGYRPHSDGGQDRAGRQHTEGRQDRAGRQRRTRQGLIVLALLAVVVAVDQAAKWWAWRHVSVTMINAGGDIITGRTIGGWFVGPITGSLLDLLDFGLVIVAVWVLARCRAVAGIAVPGALMIGGWGSNLLDRLGFHYWTAPGSVRGVVDFIHIGGYYYNLADFVIIGATPLFLLAAGYQSLRAVLRPAAAAS
jgi:lipoprotein signal peptidase